MLDEGLLYVRVKEWLQQQDWLVVGGEPPGGTDTIPRIEIKDPGKSEKGSRGSKKVDLIGFKGGYFLLVEIKPRYSLSDSEKLEEIVAKRELRVAFVTALSEKRALPAEALATDNYTAGSKYLLKAQAFNMSIKSPEYDFIFLIVSNSEVKPRFGPLIGQDVRTLFS
jgi:hypothetical protein